VKKCPFWESRKEVKKKALMSLGSAYAKFFTKRFLTAAHVKKFLYPALSNITSMGV
jgi:hypothetical protein